MGFFSKLLGGGVDKTELIRELVRFRAQNDPVTLMYMGLNEDMLNSYSSLKLHSLPDGGIVDIVESWARSRKKGIPESAIFAAIDQTRTLLFGRIYAPMPSPLNINTYINYRLIRDYKCLPLSEDTVNAAIEIAKKAYAG